MFTLKRLSKSSAARNAAASYFAFFSTAASGLLSIPIAVAYLDKDEIGLWATVNAVIGYLLWMDLGIGAAAARKLAPGITSNDRQEIDKWWSTVQSSLWILGIMVMILGICLVPLFLKAFLIPDHLTRDAWLLLAGTAVAIGINFPLRAAPGLLTAENRFHWVPVNQGITPWIQLGGFYVMVSHGWGVVAYLWATAASQLFVFLHFRLLIHTSPSRPRWRLGLVSRSSLSELLGLSLNIAVLGIKETFIKSLPTIILSRYAGLGAVPIFTFTSRPASMVVGLVRRVHHSFYPAILRSHVAGDQSDFIRRLGWSIRFTSALGLASGGAVLILNPTFIALLAGQEYFGGAAVNGWFALGVLIGPICGITLSFLQISGNMGKTGILSVINLAGVSLLMVAAFWLYGMAGLAAVFTLDMLFFGIYGLFRGSRNMGVRLSEYPKSFLFIPGTALGTLGGLCLFQNLFAYRSLSFTFHERIVPVPGPAAWVALVLVIALAACMLIGEWMGLKASPTKVQPNM